MIDLDKASLRARAKLASKRAQVLVLACSAISDPIEADDVAWGIRQVRRLALDLLEDSDAMAPLYEAVRAEDGPSGVLPGVLPICAGERP